LSCSVFQPRLRLEQIVQLPGDNPGIFVAIQQLDQVGQFIANLLLSLDDRAVFRRCLAKLGLIVGLWLVLVVVLVLDLTLILRLIRVVARLGRIIGFGARCALISRGWFVVLRRRLPLGLRGRAGRRMGTGLVRVARR
jgi:hypothetical protein